MFAEQLQKMGILEVPEGQKSPVATKRKSVDFTKLGSLSKFGTVGFSKYRERSATSKKKASNGDDDAMDSDEDDERAAKDADENEQQDPNGKLLTPEETRKQVELAEGVRQIKVRKPQQSLYDLPLTVNAAQARSFWRRSRRRTQVSSCSKARLAYHQHTTISCVKRSHGWNSSRSTVGRWQRRRLCKPVQEAKS